MSGRRPTRSLTAAALACLALAAGCSGSGSSGPGSGQAAGTAATARDQAPGRDSSPYWVDPRSDAARQVAEWEAQGRSADADVLRRISERPVADWPAGDDPAPDIEKAVRGAARDGRTVVLVAYNIPHRDCGQHSAGGADDAETYRRWIGSFADSIGSAPAIVILEPDAVAHIVDGCTPAEEHDERTELLSGAVDRLKQQPKTKVYLDAGNPAWIDDPGKLVEPLERAGVDRADGISLNVSNFQANDTVRSFGARLSGLLGGAHFVIDSSRNGNGPLPGSRTDAWCNPTGRALGTPPSDRTGDPLLDAYLWIKRPGDSDGECRGGPAAGTWWPDYALGLARRAKA
ncbi:endoglucanase [Streptomyces agglomeratus]|uniref:Glucanase n=1 Tax=Streptomyces agglomeratus TaxID=285458 RepID=A0A1E5P5Z4_9ACTN|nr:glycoside hydrolase family 6 protein [Streptomyces agglomeratus]OEJ24966.1 endoglucanase [Streptomyces agglomeratus]OEJ41026.1 endoglucanase [Streptomyces agglomeratus]OEJ44596.1 endoglucanase [Streptomyces agglomeratus]OEJ53565.1 endoglucanase [Streptomyces agglomeratus]OEJ60884.1 endoglucanase [Streptomyces agglomeratus]